MGLNSKDPSDKGDYNTKESEDVEPAGGVFPGKHHKDPRKEVSQDRSGLRLNRQPFMLTKHTKYCFRLV